MDPIYVTIKNELLKLIESHVYRVGQAIPSEDELAETYGVSRPTARRAVQLLVEADYLERRPYHGTIVKAPKINQGFATVLRSFDDEMRDNDRVPRTRVLLAHPMRAMGEVASNLGVPEDTEAFKLVRLRYADDAPNVLVASYVPLDLYPNIASVDFCSATLYGYFEQTGRPVVRAHRRLELCRSDHVLSNLLDIPEGDPVYRFVTQACSADGRVVEYAIANYRGESNAFEFDTTPTRVSALRPASR